MLLHWLKGIGLVIMLIGASMWGAASWGAERQISGAGATFPEPFYYKIFDVYSRQGGVKVQYRGRGSGTGLRELVEKRVDFAGSDIGPGGHGSDEANAAPLVRVPTCLGAVAIIYNLPDNPKLRFTGDVLADIFLGKIVRWNDPKLAALNRGVTLPDLEINVVYRSDESGTSYIFTDFLSKASEGWRKAMGPGKPFPGWRTGQGVKGNPSLTGMVRQVTGSIGYVELTYAVANAMTFGSVRNKSGNFIEPSPATVTGAANAMAKPDNGISLTDTPAPDGYPISGFTWIVVFKEQNYGGRSRESAEDLVRLLYWVTREGQKYAPSLRYVPLPAEVVKRTEVVLKSITYGGTRVLTKRP